MLLKHELIGPNAGKTIRLGGYQFIDGIFEVEVSDENLGAAAGTTKYLAVSYNAHVIGTDAHKAAKAEWAENPANKGGKADKADKKASTAKGGKANKPDADEDEEEEEEDEMTVADAAAQLDHANDAHWTSTGLPDVAAVSEILGRKTSRAEIEEETDGLKRDNNA